MKEQHSIFSDVLPTMAGGELHSNGYGTESVATSVYGDSERQSSVVTSSGAASIVTNDDHAPLIRPHENNGVDLENWPLPLAGIRQARRSPSADTVTRIPLDTNGHSPRSHGADLAMRKAICQEFEIKPQTELEHAICAAEHEKALHIIKTPSKLQSPKDGNYGAFELASYFGDEAMVHELFENGFVVQEKTVRAAYAEGAEVIYRHLLSPLHGAVGGRWANVVRYIVWKEPRFRPGPESFSNRFWTAAPSCMFRPKWLRAKPATSADDFIATLSALYEHGWHVKDMYNHLKGSFWNTVQYTECTRVLHDVLKAPHIPSEVQVGVVQFLVDRNAPLLLPENLPYEFPLHTALVNGALGTVPILLQRNGPEQVEGVLRGLPEKSRIDALCQAVLQAMALQWPPGWYDCMLALLENGADVDSRNQVPKDKLPKELQARAPTKRRFSHTNSIISPYELAECSDNKQLQELLAQYHQG